MAYEDRISIATPEGLDLDLTLAGLGSRFVAALLDGVIQFAVLMALWFLGFALGIGFGAAGVDDDVGGGAVAVLAAVALVLVFLVLFGYHVAFETWASGRSPGKRWTGLRVVRTAGAPVSFLTSAVRNLLRLVDFLPSAYGVGMIAILASSRNQRLGDMAAGTLVVRERRAPRPGSRAADSSVSPPPSRPEPATVWEGAAPAHEGWDVSSVTAEELATVRRFLDRRPYLTPDARGRLAWELASRLRPKVTGPSEDLHPETFLAEVAAAKSERG
ncbi:MAG: RDD family protein [Actinomycetota bacterium]|nr:RDD family protein [Actinomycetota bacterium]